MTMRAESPTRIQVKTPTCPSGVVFTPIPISPNLLYKDRTTLTLPAAVHSNVHSVGGSHLSLTSCAASLCAATACHILLTANQNFDQTMTVSLTLRMGMMTVTASLTPRTTTMIMTAFLTPRTLRVGRVPRTPGELVEVPRDQET